MAGELLAGIGRMGEGNIRELSFTKGVMSYSILSCGEDEPTTLLRAMIDSSHPDDKWCRRPISGEQRNAVISAVTEGLWRITQCKADDESGTPSYGMLHAPRFRITYVDGMELVGDMRSDCGGVGEWIDDRVSEVFQSVVPRDMDFGETLGHLQSFEYAFGGFLGGYSSTSTVSKDADSRECRLVIGTTDLHVVTPSGPVGEEREVPLSQNDWDNLVDAIREADLPNWELKYDRFGVADGWWQRLEAKFGNG